MKLRRASLLGLALSAVAATGAFAQTFGSDEPYTGPDGPYLRGEGGLSHMNDETGAGAVANPIQFHSSENWGYIAGGAAGYKIGQLRLELGLDFSGYDVSALSISNDGGLGARLGGASMTGASARPSGSVSTVAGMVNALWDLRTGTPWVPYFGIGVGMANVKLDNFTVAGRPLSNSGDTVFAYQPIAGVHYFLTDNLALGLEYRYFATVQPTFKDSSGVPFTGRMESHNILANLSYFFGVAPAVAAPAPPPPAPPVQEINPSAGPQKQTFVVYFDTNRASLTPEGRRAADAAVAAFQQTSATHIEVMGFTDTAGAAGYNLELSRRRAETVHDYLAQHGVPANEMDVSWHGETDLAVPTPAGVRQGQNRRVEIDIP